MRSAAVGASCFMFHVRRIVFVINFHEIVFEVEFSAFFALQQLINCVYLTRKRTICDYNDDWMEVGLYIMISSH